MNEDLQHLRLLSIFHYIVAGLAGLFSLMPVIHLVFGLAILSGAFDPANEAPEARLIGGFFVVIAATIILMGLTFTVLLAIAGRNLAARRHRTFCLVMAGLSCIFMPFGTVLGVFTIIVLMRDSVQKLFAGSAPGGAAGDGQAS